ncbi:MAG: hypothetical protein ACPLXC_00320 [Candidatus Pacearchaeota archaeon]
MENNIFWAFLAVTFIVGLTLGIAIYGLPAGITGRAAFFPFTPAINCNDTDGINLAVKGACIDPYGTKTDVCSSPTNLVEYWCMNGTNISYCVSQVYNCVSYGYTGCYDGACVGSNKSQAATGSVSGVPATPATSGFGGSAESMQIYNYVTTQSSQLFHCGLTNDFSLDSEHSIFHLSKCDRAIFSDGNRRKEVTLHGVYFDTMHRKFVAHIQYKYFLDDVLCTEEDILSGTEDSGFAVDILEIRSKLTNSGESIQMVLATIPDNVFADSCFNTVGTLGSGGMNGRYVIVDDEVTCQSGGWQCKCEESSAR